MIRHNVSAVALAMHVVAAVNAWEVAELEAEQAWDAADETAYLLDDPEAEVQP